MCNAYKALQELLAVALMMPRMAFVYLVKWLPCIWITALLKCILNMANMHSGTLIPA